MSEIKITFVKSILKSLREKKESLGSKEKSDFKEITGLLEKEDFLVYPVKTG